MLFSAFSWLFLQTVGEMASDNKKKKEMGQMRGYP